MKLLGHDLVKRSALFALSIVVSTLVGVFSIPILIAHIGAPGWGYLAVLQIVGQFFAVATAFGWGATGPSMVSAAPRGERKSIYADSLVVRLCLLALLLPIAVVVGAALTGQRVELALLAAVTYVTPGLNAAWYLIGTNRPAALFVFDALPAILGQITGLVAVLVFPSLETYLLATAVWAIIGVVASATFVLTRAGDGPARVPRRTPWSDLLKSQVGGVSTMLSTGVWSAAPTILVQALSPQNVPMFAIVDRLVKYGILALAPILQAIQSWVPEAGRHHILTRSRGAVLISLGVGATGGVLLGAFAPLAAELLTLGQAPIPVLVAVIAGIAFGCECVAQISGLSSLVALGGTRYLAISSVLGTVGGLAITAGLVSVLGVVGAVSGLAAVALWLAASRLVWVRQLSKRWTGEAVEGVRKNGDLR